MKQTNINIDEIKRFPTVTNPIKADDLHTPQAYAYTLRRAIVTDCNDRQRAELVALLEGKDTAEGVTFNNTKANRDRLHIWQNGESRKERAAILGEGWQWIEGLNHGTEPGDLITCTDGTRGRVTKADPESCVIELETENGQRLTVAGYFRYTPSEKSETADERKAADTMKRYTINCHYDMVISVDVIAESEEQALRLAYDKAAGMSIDGAECVGHSECVTDTEELTAGELRTMEREAVTEFVSEYVEQQTPTECKDIADGYGVNWLEWVGQYDEEWKNKLFGTISEATHKDTALFERYAQMYARSRWQQVADDLRAQWAKAFSKARREPEAYRVIVETNEEDPTAPANEFGRYYMVDGSESESCIEHAGQWVVIRVDTVTSPYEVHRPNHAAAHGYSDDQTQLACRCENPNNVTRWARKMIDAGRVTDIYADCY